MLPAKDHLGDRLCIAGKRVKSASLRCSFFSKHARRRRLWLRYQKDRSERRMRITEKSQSVEEGETFLVPPGGPAWPGAVCTDVDAAILLASMQAQLETFVESQLQFGADAASPARRGWKDSHLVGNIASSKFISSVRMMLHSGTIARDANFRVLSLADACGNHATKSTINQEDANNSSKNASMDISLCASPLRFLLRAGLTRCISSSPSAVNATRGNGWYTTEDLPEGCTVVAELPICCLMDAEVAQQSWARSFQEGERRALGMRLAEILAIEKKGPAAHRALQLLHPPPNSRDAKACNSLPPASAMKLRAMVKAAWGPLSWLDAAERARLQMVLNLNVFRVATCDEQLSSSREYSALSCAGLYAFGAGFNHSCFPNVARYSIGPWLLFRTCRQVRAGEELCFSYLDPEVLHMSRKQRARDLDFLCSCPRCLGSLPPPAARKSQLAPLVGIAAKERIVDILRRMQQHDFGGALELWVASAAEHIDTIVAPFEDALVRAATQSALCAWALAATHATRRNAMRLESISAGFAVRCLRVAVRVHHVAFGGGAAMYLQRYHRELAADLPQVWGLGSSESMNPHAWACWRSACDRLQMTAQKSEFIAAATDESFGCESLALEVLKWSQLIAEICDGSLE